MEIFNTTWKVMIPIFKYPTKGLSIREISRLSKVAHPSVIKIVKKLEKSNLVSIEKRRNGFLIRANLENEKFVELKKLYNLISLKELVEYIKEKFEPEVIICFGSFASGIDIESSDIDLFIGNKEVEINEKELSKFEKKLCRKIQIFSGNLKDLPKELRENIVNGVKLFGWLRI